MNSEEVRFGDVIRKARKDRGWTQAELGEKSGVSRPTIARIEADSEVTTTTIAKVARALGLTLQLRIEGPGTRLSGSQDIATKPRIPK